MSGLNATRDASINGLALNLMAVVFAEKRNHGAKDTPGVVVPQSEADRHKNFEHDFVFTLVISVKRTFAPGGCAASLVRTFLIGQNGITCHMTVLKHKFESTFLKDS